MSGEELEIKVGIVVQKPARVVFEAIVDPEGMTNYFIAKSSGRMEEGKELIWKFPEMDLEFPVRIGKIEQDSYISFFWKGLDEFETLVEMTLTTKENNSTMVTVTEKGRFEDKAGIKWLKENTEGWANFLACLKAWLEYGINLRKGAFDLSQMPEK